MKESIGEKIEREVRKQQLSIVEFAEKINCKRQNVYNIFKRNTIDILQLKLISQVLNRNFFKEISEDMDIITNPVETEEMRTNRSVISQFLEVVPGILNKFGKDSTIVFTQLKDVEYADAVPDFGIPDLNFTFTIGNTLRDRNIDNNLLEFADFYDCYTEFKFEVVTSLTSGKSFINIPVQYYTEEEWIKIFQFIFDTLSEINLIKQ